MRIRKKKILIVEDQSVIAIDLRKSLSKMGYIVVAISDNAEDAVSVVKECKPDLVLMDIMLNGDKSGIEAAEIIRVERDIPIIYLTALTDVDTYLRAAKTEPYKYLMKPLEMESLERVIREIFENTDSSMD